MKKFGTVVAVPSSFSDPALIAFSSGLPLVLVWWPRVAGRVGVFAWGRVAEVVVVETEEAPSDPERVGVAVVDERVVVVEVDVVEVEVEVVRDGVVVNPEVVVEVLGGADDVIVVEVVGVALVDVEFVVLEAVVVVVVAEVVVVPGTQLADSDTCVRSSEPAGTTPALTSASTRSC